jgi:hypothetical protein
MYEQPSMHMELARQRHEGFLAEAERAHLASKVERGPSETLSIVKSLAVSLKKALRAKPIVVRQTQPQPTA